MIKILLAHLILRERLAQNPLVYLKLDLDPDLHLDLDLDFELDLDLHLDLGLDLNHTLQIASSLLHLLNAFWQLPVDNKLQPFQIHLRNL